ncbi:hypothetical protein [Neolewinella agarilytica]|uniref:hypothetical protein n=1 Tax=Neolewinella agarilytica TaxID=478744 RepID=UPI002354C451|nr:hypothetical protein [Neolewinella agarilytica]
MRYSYLYLLFMLVACAEESPSDDLPLTLPLTTQSDSTRHYYHQGWKEIMDEGHYGPSETTYRQALSFDPDFLLGKATLGRLTLDTTERRRIERELEGAGKDLPKDERDLLGLYTDFVRFTNMRDHSPAAAYDMLSKVLPGGQHLLGQLVHKYPDEVYLKCEYVELINSNHGPEIALDSLAVLTRERHADNPFLMGFKASLLAETGQHEDALATANELATMLDRDDWPKPHAVYADVYFAMDSLQLAKTHADKAVELDYRNLDASRLQTRIDREIERRLKE